MNRMSILVLSALVLGVGCGPKKSAESASTETSTADSQSTSLTKFQKKLVDTTISNWEPIDGSSVEFIYQALNFSADGTWKANGVVKADFEEFPCTETGIWSVTSEDSANSGVVEWTLKNSDCISRDPGVSLRTLIEFSGGDYKISFR